MVSKSVNSKGNIIEEMRAKRLNGYHVDVQVPLASPFTILVTYTKGGVKESETVRCRKSSFKLLKKVASSFRIVPEVSDNIYLESVNEALTALRIFKQLGYQLHMVLRKNQLYYPVRVACTKDQKEVVCFTKCNSRTLNDFEWISDEVMYR